MKPFTSHHSICGIVRKGVMLFIFSLACAYHVHAQYQVIKVYGNTCVGSDQIFVFTGSCSVIWGTTGTIVSQSGNMVTVRWNSPTSNAYVWASYSCSSYPFTGTVSSPTYTISNAVTPAVSITSNYNNVCETTNITFTASPVNGGSPPTYSWRVNGNAVSTSNSATYSSSGLKNGDVVSVVMYSNASCVTTGSATSNNIVMNLTPPSAATAILTGPQTICSNATTSASFVVSVNNGGGSATYTWLRNGATVTDRLNGPPAFVYVPQNPLNSGDKIKCVVSFGGSSCISPNPVESNEFTVSLTSPTSPYVSIQIPGIQLCSGSSITFTAASPYLTGGSSYVWRLSGSQISTSASVTLPVSTNTNELNAFSPGDVLTVDVSGLSGTCLSSWAATGSTTGIPFSFIPIPSASISPSGTLKISASASQAITASPSGSGYNYQWKNNGTDIPGATQSSYDASASGLYRVVITPAGCASATAGTSGTLNLIKNVPPAVSAGPNQTVYLPGTSATLNGSASDPDGGVVSYAWTKQSGPSATLSGTTTPTLSLSNLVLGDYVFRLTAQDDLDTRYSEVTVSVRYPLNNYNAIVETIVQVKGINSNATIPTLSIGEKSVVTSYFDGYGRLMQTVVPQGSPLHKDVVQPVDYDAYGREAVKYLPYASAEDNGWYKSSFIPKDAANYGTSEQYQFYQLADKVAHDASPYSATVFEPSPLDRTIKQGSGGAVWQPDGNNTYASTDRTIKKSYQTNAAGEVLSWTHMELSGTSDPFGLITAHDGTNYIYYGANKLIKNKTRDEQRHEVIEYTDNKGRTVLKRVQAVEGDVVINDVNYASTYYIFNDFNQLVCVIPPEATKLITKQPSEFFGKTDNEKIAFLKQWTFRYTYDERGRMDRKQVPGSEPVYMAYDDRDRPVMTQNGNQRSKVPAEWTFTKYDALNRPILTGIYKDNAQRSLASMQNDINTYYAPGVITTFYEEEGTAVHGYTNRSFPSAGNEADYLTVTYYDNYSQADSWSGFSYTNENLTQTANGVQYTQPGSRFERVTGQVTAVKVKNLTSGSWLRSVRYYDNQYRAVQVVSENNLGGKDRTTLLYDFTGKMLQTKVVSGKPGKADVTVLRSLQYDHGQRLVSSRHKAGSSAEVILLKNEYNEMGKVTAKKLHGSPSGTVYRQTVDYRYNIRGWLDNINDVDAATSDDLFSMDLNYHNPVANGGPAQYNGNISQARWKGPENETMSYAYTHDAMNRLTKGLFYNATAPVQNGRFDERIGDDASSRPAYDLNGNILNLLRNGKTGQTAGVTTYGAMDDLVYTYSGGNRLARVTDNQADTEGFKEGTNAGDDYSYDGNGNMNHDLNKGIGNDLADNSNKITYNYLNLPERVQKSATIYMVNEYDATGKKLRQTTVENGSSKIIDYAGELVYENDVLLFINHEEGRVVMTGADPEYQYHLKDHLENVRVTFTTRNIVDSPVATMETANASAEQGQFLYHAEAVKVNTTLFDHTDQGPTYYSTRLNGAVNERTGLARSISVMPGDTVKTEVYAKYLDTNSGSWTTALNNLITSIANGTAPAGTFVDGGAPGSTGGIIPAYLGLLNKGSETGTAPKAYLNYLIFDRDFNFISGGFMRMTTAAREYGQDAAHEKLAAQFVITKPGYVYIYLSNDNAALGGPQVEVYFDDFKVTHVKSPVIERTDFYPFGLQFNNFTRENAVPDRKKFQGQEHIDELGLGWDSFKWRNYMPEVGRFFNADPLAEKYVYNSLYAFAENKVITFRELEGLEGVHYMDGKDHIIEKNIVVLVKPLKEIPKDANAETVAKIKKQNEKIGKENAEKLASVSSELNTYFNGSDGKGVKNSKDETVRFKFNVTSAPDIEKKGKPQERDNIYYNVGRSNGMAACIESLQGGGIRLVAPAAVLTTEGAGSAQGRTLGAIIMKFNFGAPEGTIAHEVLHTLGVSDNDYTSGGLRNSPPEQISSEEVDEVIKASYEKD